MSSSFDEDITIERPIHGPPPKLYQAVVRELNRLWVHYGRLSQAREERNLCKIGTFAEDCVYQWLLAQVARRKLDQTGRDQDHYVQSARTAVDGAAHLLAPHLRPMAQLPPEARRRLARLRLSIRLAKVGRGEGRKAPSAL